MHLPGQIGVVEAIRVADALARLQLEILAAEGMAVAGGEIRERHAKAAADAGLQLRHLAGEAMGRQPFGQGVRLDKGSVYPHRRGLEYAVQCHGSSGHEGYLLGGSAARIVAHGDVGRWPGAGPNERGCLAPPLSCVVLLR
ncbi:hypothetical protein D3C76_1294500 [compost metagenome]